MIQLLILTVLWCSNIKISTPTEALVPNAKEKACRATLMSCLPDAKTDDEVLSCLKKANTWQ